MTSHSTTICPPCEARGKTWSGDDPICAFPSGVFDTDNWNCATMNRLRELARKVGLFYRDDEFGTLAAVPVEGKRGIYGYVVMCFYKERGRTNVAQIINDEGVYPLTLENAMEAIRTCERLLALQEGEDT